MPSSPASPGGAPHVDVPFRLRELTACWDQAYEALARADVARAGDLLAIAEEHLRDLPAAASDDAECARLRALATAAHGRLASGMRAGLDALAGELANLRRGQKALHGYSGPSHGLGNRVESRA